ncbi:MAG TPA: nitroreductase [Mogibacterium sp.]|nr:nitroreductase [Mogibacterium sp.]
MNPNYYPAIFKRKSFHLFRNVGSAEITKEELDGIQAAYDSCERLYTDIRTAIRIVPAKKVSFRPDAEYCILIYSEKKDNYLMNAGYIGEQLDLHLVSNNIGSLWFGIGKPDKKTCDGLDFVIMIAIRKIEDESLFRNDMFRAKRKPLEETWEGDTLGVAEIARFSPSACNSQPWFVRNDGNSITVFRYRQSGIQRMLPAAVIAKYFNRIDIGIYLCILEICMAEKKIEFTRELHIDTGDDKTEYSKVAVYKLK